MADEFKSDEVSGKMHLEFVRCNGCLGDQEMELCSGCKHNKGIETLTDYSI